jgi:hypothetical protein
MGYKRDKIIKQFEKNLEEAGYSLCAKYIKNGYCDAGEDCIHLIEVRGIRLCVG